MIRFARLWESRRTLLVVMSLAALILASLGLALFAEAHHEKQTRQAAQVQAQILADSVSAALAFNDMDTIREYTSALRANPDIEAVAVYGETGQLVAHYGPEPIGGRAGPPADGDTSIIVNVPVTQNGTRLGSVYFRVRAEAIGIRLARYSGASLLVIMASLMLTVMAFDSRALTRGNARLKQEIAEREAVEAALRQSQKMEAIGRLTGGIAHDFNNMLAVILGNLDLLTRRFPQADQKLLTFVASSQEAAKRAASLTQRLLAFSRRAPLDPRSTDVGKSVADMSDLLGRTLGETIAIETVRSAGLWRAHIDAAQLEMALVNLAVNARDAMPNGGRLTIETTNTYLDRTYANAQAEVVPGQYVLVAVTDTGTGMTPDIIDKVFEPFFTTKPSGLGTGLGLSQVHGFVKQSGGHVTIYSEPSGPNHGTTVKLYLPRSREEGDIVLPEPPKRAHKSRREATVLVVDDEEGVRAFAAEALVELGYDVLSADGADQALSILEGADINILLTDVVMPGKSGRVLADAVTKAKPDVRVLYMTGYTQNAIVHNGVLDAGTHLITKPFTIGQLGEELDAIMGMR
jgi:signal transduction histidine kinase